MTPDAVVAAAREWLGTPYRHQASAVGAGCDCLGLVRGVWRTVCGDEPMALPPYGPGWRDRRSGELLAAAERWLLRVEGPPAAGQVVLFRLAGAAGPRHCGIMVADDRFIHAQERVGVVEANLGDGWRRRIAARFWFPAS
jgi:NlpC/P60 family putative phage cell wall peptidase